MLKCEKLSYSNTEWSASFSFACDAGEWVGVAGPSGSGKSTLLSLLSGFTAPTSGEAYIATKAVTALPPSKRGINTMFQRSSLLPHLSCRRNFELALHNVVLPPSERAKRVADAIAVSNFPEHYLDRLPGALSGGELARMNLARALVRPSSWVLLDEPFAAIDQHLRTTILIHLDVWRKRYGVGILLVSHEPSDAILMADKLVFIENGSVSGFGHPRELAEQPATEGMARLLKRGTVFELNGRTAFILPEGIRTSPPAAVHTGWTEIRVEQFRVAYTQASQHVIDLARDQAWVLSNQDEFRGRLYLDNALIRFF